MKVSVFHAVKFGYGEPSKFADPSEYTAVAVVEAVDFEEAFKLTNNIDSLWCEGEAVVYLSPEVKAAGGCRSTSVGDVMIGGCNTVAVASFGFDLIDKVVF